MAMQALWPLVMPPTCAQEVSAALPADPKQPYDFQLSSLLGTAPAAPLAAEMPVAAVGSSEPRTTVMLRDLPGGFTRRKLLDFLDSQGFAGRYDFAYLPVSFETRTSLTHAFVNMVSPEDAKSLYEHLEGFSNWDAPSDSVCHVVWNDKYQGLSELIEPFLHGDLQRQMP